MKVALHFIIELWFSPLVNGSRSPPYSSFPVTVTDKDRAAVMLGGYNKSTITHDAWALYLPSMVSHFWVVQ